MEEKTKVERMNELKDKINELSVFIKEYEKSLTIKDNFDRLVEKDNISQKCKLFLKEKCNANERVQFYLLGVGLRENFDFAKGIFEQTDRNTKKEAEKNERIGQIVINLVESALSDDERKYAYKLSEKYCKEQNMLEK